jgi:hypothetical protein
VRNQKKTPANPFDLTSVREYSEKSNVLKGSWQIVRRRAPVNFIGEPVVMNGFQLRAAVACVCALLAANAFAQNADSTGYSAGGVPTVNGVWNVNASASGFSNITSNLTNVENTAYSTAVSGQSVDNSAQNTETTAQSYATSSESVANTAYSYANQAASWSNSAVSAAGSANSVAGSAQNTAGAASGLAASAASNTSGSYSHWVIEIGSPGVPCQSGGFEPGVSWLTSYPSQNTGVYQTAGGFQTSTGENCGEG